MGAAARQKKILTLTRPPCHWPPCECLLADERQAALSKSWTAAWLRSKEASAGRHSHGSSHKAERSSDPDASSLPLASMRMPPCRRKSGRPFEKLDGGLASPQGGHWHGGSCMGAAAGQKKSSDPDAPSLPLASMRMPPRRRKSGRRFVKLDGGLASPQGGYWHGGSCMGAAAGQKKSSDPDASSLPLASMHMPPCRRKRGRRFERLDGGLASPQGGQCREAFAWVQSQRGKKFRP
jgi:hypothetical protein